MLCRGGSDFEMKRLLILFAFFFACAAPESKKYYVYSSEDSKKEAVSKEFSRIYELSKTPDYDLERKFEEALEDSSSKAFSNASGHFSYSLTPFGAVYPFSSVKVVCFYSGSTSQSEAEKTCGNFFKELDIKYSLLK